MNIKLKESDKVKIITSDDLYSIMQKILLRENKIDKDREHFWVIGLELNSKLSFIELISLGSQSVTLAEPMDVFSLALQKRSARIVLVHNHPSGEVTPSEADKQITDRLIQTGIIVNVEVLDHLIISTKSYTSFRNTGVLDHLKKSTKYVPSYKLIEKIKKEAAEISVRNERLLIAKKLKNEGLEIEKIALITGLSVAEITAIKASRKRK